MKLVQKSLRATQRTSVTGDWKSICGQWRSLSSMQHISLVPNAAPTARGTQFNCSSGQLGIFFYFVSVSFILMLSVTRMYGCETWSLTWREEHRLRVFENSVLRRIFGSKRDGVTGEWRKLHNEELNDLYCSPNIVRVIKWRRMRWAGHVARTEEGRDVHKGLVWKREG